jgi:endonuclease/exonuclease/phosphatase family metal-dependent hydrolase
MHFTSSILTLRITFASAATIPSLARRQDSDTAVEDISFPVEQVTLKNARIAERYEAKVAGFVLGPGNESASFDKVSGVDWVEVSRDGIISGTPAGTSERVAEVTVQANSASQSTATLQIAIPVRKAEEALLEQLTVMSYNLWKGGSNINNYHEKQLSFILQTGADIIGLQESIDGDHAERLANALGYGVWATKQSASILSRYPIVERYNQTAAGLGVQINLNGDRNDKKEVNFWNAHPTAYPYGPYGFCRDGSSKQDVFDIEAESGRTNQMAEIIEAMTPQLANSENVPVLLTGDMNAPSHLDYVEGLRKKNCGIADFGWPTSVLPQQAGLIDSYRVVYPDPVAVQGTTWSPVYPFSEGETGDPEPQDRIDFIYATKQLEVVQSETKVVGTPKPPPNEADNEWTSDHAAMLTRYQLA